MYNTVNVSTNSCCPSTFLTTFSHIKFHRKCFGDDDACIESTNSVFVRVLDISYRPTAFSDPFTDFVFFANSFIAQFHVAAVIAIISRC